ncbi:hypothetical protein [Xylella fastidiosa]|uniref:hypothetical protein n=1 Tax=Xylella fastidiosa TaxID=2371 RepID=UPI0039854E00
MSARWREAPITAGAYSDETTARTAAGDGELDSKRPPNVAEGVQPPWPALRSWAAVFLYP